MFFTNIDAAHAAYLIWNKYFFREDVAKVKDALSWDCFRFQMSEVLMGEFRSE